MYPVFCIFRNVSIISTDQPMFFRWDHRRPTNDSANWINHAGLKYHVVTLKIDKCFGRSVLEIFHANVSKVGEYVCIVFNKNTFVAKSAWVMVQGKVHFDLVVSRYISEPLDN